MKLDAVPAHLQRAVPSALDRAIARRIAANKACEERKDDSNIAELMKAFKDAVAEECALRGIKYER